MTQNINELKSRIVQTNQMIDSIKHSGNAEGEIARGLRQELDRLLYLYFKLLRCG